MKFNIQVLDEGEVLSHFDNFTLEQLNELVQGYYHSEDMQVLKARRQTIMQEFDRIDKELRRLFHKNDNWFEALQEAKERKENHHDNIR